jgi:para-nitrobenzyl esterase
MMLSGTCFATARSTAETAGKGVAKAVHCDAALDVAGCLRAATAEDITRAPVVFTVRRKIADYNAPTIDGHVLDEYPLSIIKQGKHNHVPIIESSTRDEDMTLSPLNVASFEQLESDVRTEYGAGQTKAILDLYSAYASPEFAMVAMISDVEYICPTRTDARTFAAAQLEPVRRAFFTHTFESGPYRRYGAAHGMDLFFGFHVFGTDPASASELALADTIAGYWTRFARTGDPNGAGAVPWPVYDASADNAMRLDETPTMMGPVRKPYCDYWDWYFGG